MKDPEVDSVTATPGQLLNTLWRLFEITIKQFLYLINDYFHLGVFVFFITVQNSRKKFASQLIELCLGIFYAHFIRQALKFFGW
jgi:hypothetical protein